jgi:DNA-binding MarR family transcriptional regulator
VSADDYPLGPALGFLRSVWRLNHAVELRSARMEATLGISAQQRMMLRCLGAFPGITAGRIATVLHLDPGTVTAMLKRLEAGGLLVRRRDPRDGRRVLVGLTEAGRALDRPTPETVESAVESLLAEIGPEAAAITASVLDRLSGMLESGPASGPGDPPDAVRPAP